jgi:hypothetical protein
MCSKRLGLSVNVVTAHHRTLPDTFMQRIPNVAAVLWIRSQWRFSFQLKALGIVALLKIGMKVADMYVRHLHWDSRSVR